MPKKRPEDMARRREEILQAAKHCFAHKGFAATTIGDLCTESGISAGGIYTHFANKHAIVEAIEGELSRVQHGGQPLEPRALFAALLTDAGRIDARLDLSLWAETLRDPKLHELVTRSMDSYRDLLKRAVPRARRSSGWLQLLEALSLGLEVQRALGRPQSRSLGAAIAALLEES